ncbi:peptidylprolyl isomerase [Melioribacteraceae bacterium 4301-Me]|uniref:peptidylprolyl isomerase n=1 Tax=Pyranulibacter aquaticus TaxID=3163344 RepID=UPI00359B455F
MRNGKYLFFAFLLSLIFTSCATENSKIIVARFDDDFITAGELKEAYLKNNSGDTTLSIDSLNALDNFLNLYLNYRMKLRDAFVRGYTKDKDLQDEIDNYKFNVGKTLFLEDKFYEPNLRKMYERRKWEFRVSHIFIRIDSAHNEKQAYQLAKSLIDSIKNGADFRVLCKKYSDDSSTKNNGGDVYYVTSGMITNPVLENAVYSTPVGEVYPEPIKTLYGYHIIKITDKVKRIESVRASHILIAFADSSGKTDTAEALKKAEAIRDSLLNGADFGDMAKKYSFDKVTAKKGGDLGYFSRGRMVIPFDEMAFKLKVGEISPIVKTNFGFHIIKVTDRKPIPSFEESRDELKNLFQRTLYQTEFDKLRDSLSKQFDYQQFQNNIGMLLSNFDTLKVGVNYDTSTFKQKYGNTPIFSVSNKNYNLDSLINWMSKNGYNNQRLSNKNVFDNGIRQYSNEILIKQRIMNYDKEDPKFAQLMKDYAKGVYLFKILEEEVWNKIKIDTNKILQMFDSTRNKYWTNDRVKYLFVSALNDSVINNYKNLLKSGYSFDTLVVDTNPLKAKALNAEFKDVNNNEVAKVAFELKNPGDISEPFKYKNTWYIVKLIEKQPKRLKTFEEAKPELISLYQDKESKRLENEYVNRLKKLYHPEIYYEKLKEALFQNK